MIIGPIDINKSLDKRQGFLFTPLFLEVFSAFRAYTPNDCTFLLGTTYNYMVYL